MKRIVYAAAALIAVFALVFMGCEDKPKPNDNPVETEFTINFDTDGGTPETIDSIVVQKGQSMGDKYPAPPTKSGYIFMGWFDSKGDKYDAESPILGNLLLIAEWEVRPANSILISFNLNGGHPNLDPVLITSGTSLGTLFPNDPTKEGSRFLGWFTSTTSSTPVTADDIFNTPPSNVTLSARWAELITITFDLNGGKIDDKTTYGPITIDKGTALGEQFPAEPEHATNKFVGWFKETDVSKENLIIAATILNESVKLVADYMAVDASKWVVSFHTGDGSPVAAIQVVKGEGMGALYPADPTLADYAFGGWFSDNETFLIKFDAATPITESIDLYAKWIPKFTVTFNPNGGTPATIPSVSIAQGSTLDALPEVTRALYTLDGWYTAATGGTKITVPYTVTANVTLIARWNYTGGSAEVVDGALVHTSPAFILGGNAALQEDTSISFPSGASGTARYDFPSGASAYDYFVIDRTMISGEARNAEIYVAGTTTRINPIPLGLNQNTQPWLANPDWLVLAVSQPTGPMPGITLSVPSAGEGVILFNSITFYKAPRYTVQFDWNLEGTAQQSIAPVTNVMGSTTHIPTIGVGAANWPTAPASETIDSTTYYFVGWFDGEHGYTSSTPITKDVTLKGVWESTPPAMVVKVDISHNSNGVYGFVIPEGVTYGDVASVSFKALATAKWSGSVHRGHTIHIPKSLTLPSNGQFNIGSLSSWADVADRPFAANSFDDIWTASYVLNSWKQFNWAITMKGTSESNGIPAATTNATVYLGVGFAANNATNTYLIKDVKLVLKEDATAAIEANGSSRDIPAIEVTDANLSWTWYHANAGVSTSVVAKRSLVPDVYEDEVIAP